MDGAHTTAALQRYLDRLAEAPDTVREGLLVRELLARAAQRLEVLCAAFLHRNYPRLTRPPLNLRSEEMLSAVVERLLKALDAARPATTRQFFALANQHMRWELNDLARRLDEAPARVEPRDAELLAPEASTAGLSPDARRILAAIEALPAEEREVFDLVRIQGLMHSEVAELLGVATKTVQRRLNRGLLLLTEALGDLRADPRADHGDAGTP